MGTLFLDANRLRGMASAIASIALCSVAVQAAAQPSQAAYPARPVRLVVPYSPGGAADALARMTAQMIGDRIHGTIVVDDKPGAGGVIGTDMVAKAPADGYTLAWGGSAALAVNVTLQKGVPYDPVKDFAPICRLATGPFVLAVSSATGVKTVADLLALAKQRPLTYASAGVGTGSHISMELLKSRSGLKADHVVYKGTAPAVNDVLGGHVDMLFEAIGPLLPHIRSGKLVPVGTTSVKRLAALPDVPTFQEAGYADFRLDAWMGLLAPAATPPAVLTTLAEACRQMMASPQARDGITAQFLEPDYAGPEEFGAFIKSEIPKWARLLDLAGAKPE